MTILVHDYLLVMRGAERSFMAMCDMFPGSPVATLLYDAAVFGEQMADRRVTTSPYQRLGADQRRFKALLPLLPQAAERLPVAGHKLVLSSSSAFAHGVRPDPDATHVCYCYTPFRYAWYEQEAGIKQAPRLVRPLVRRSLNRIREWDHDVAQRTTHYIAISRLSRERIRRFWDRDAAIVYPPVQLDRFAPGTPEDFFLVVGELVQHKQVDIALEAARRANVRIKVVGGGPEEERLRQEYGHGADFLGRVSDGELSTLYPRARALVMPNLEEFGITAVECQASGRPVIAADGGGARETVVHGETGLLVPPGDVAAIARAMLDPALDAMRPEHAVCSAERFSLEVFQRRMRTEIDRVVANQH